MEYRQRWNVPFVYSSNGHQFVEYDHLTGHTSGTAPMNLFPKWKPLLERYLQNFGFDASDPTLAAILRKPMGDRYYQRAAARAVIEHVAAGNKRALLSLATGTGKTRIAVDILRAFSHAKILRRALFVCDRDELRIQALGTLSYVFGSDAASAKPNNPEKNARIIVATYQNTWNRQRRRRLIFDSALSTGLLFTHHHR